MIKTVEVKVSAREATTYKKEMLVCDECESKSVYFKCLICRCDLCRKCVVEKYESECGDYPNRYCQGCWEVGEKYRDVLLEEEKAHDEKVDQIENQWKEVGKQLRGDK